jgi:colicin import membrane protein
VRDRAGSFNSFYGQDLLIGFLKSLSLHIAVIFLFALTTLILKIAKSQNGAGDIIVVSSSVKVDIVAMPTLSLQELKKLQLPEFGSHVESDQAQEISDAPKEQLIETDVVKPVEKKVDLKNLLSSFSQKKIDAPIAKKNPVKNTGVSSGIDKGVLDNLILKGNKLSQGTAIIGDVGNDQSAQALSGYAVNLPNLVKPHWKLPSYLIDLDLRCRIRVFISATGDLTNIEVFESSGQSEYDQKALQAVRKAAPFPAPPKDAQFKLANGQIILGFPL